ncbi:hypothetical protein [Fulvivirga sediminis]|uniref:Uncharacterized protein n=1 Tax=Fulvivirga sediminis TaxID=2803949 RepID=A0A937F5S9_9BACT|nr:hypothetical protein [Fulvivirga sediminis]MBL3655492.1 hypothetical protein [Fulvivirga sediminis]
MINILTIEPIKQFMLKRASVNFIINLILTFGIQCWALRHFDNISFSSGEQSLVRTFLPMSFFLPLFVTMDSAKRFFANAFDEKIPYFVPEKYKTFKFRFILGLKNAGWSLLIFSIILAAVFLLSPKNMMFNSMMVIIILTSVAGVMAVIFTITPIMHIQKAIKKQNSIP